MQAGPRQPPRERPGRLSGIARRHPGDEARPTGQGPGVDGQGQPDGGGAVEAVSGRPATCGRRVGRRGQGQRAVGHRGQGRHGARIHAARRGLGRSRRLLRRGRRVLRPRPGRAGRLLLHRRAIGGGVVASLRDHAALACHRRRGGELRRSHRLLFRRPEDDGGVGARAARDEHECLDLCALFRSRRDLAGGLREGLREVEDQ